MDNSPRENTCVVCFRSISIYAVGDCDHYDRICYICSTRLRVLCNKYECPICRKDIPKVIFSKHRQPYGALSRIDYPLDHKYKIAFADDEVRSNYETLLEHACELCPTRRAFNCFGHLKDHIRKEHRLFFCELCVDNLKLFTHERRCYTSKDLGIHRRIGDADDTSHRGHPSCQFCESRYMDKDELFRHLRKDHFFCHFCDSDGHYLFYGEYKYLQDHFREEHFLCEEGSCKEEKFTGVFRSQIDLKYHKATQHSKNMNKQQARQARTLELEFTYRHRPRANQPMNDTYDSSARRGRKGPPARSARDTRNTENDEDEQFDYTQWSVSAPDTHSQKEFPQLGDAVDGQPPPSSEGRVSINVVPPKPYGKRFNAHSEEDFPTLSGAPSSVPAGAMTSTRVTLSSPQQSRTANSVLFKINNKDKGTGSGNISIHVSSKPKPVINTEDFPSLSSQPTKYVVQTNTTAPVVAASRVNQCKQAVDASDGKSNQEVNGWKTAKGPLKPAFEEEFPKLVEKQSNQGKRVSSLTIPIGGSSWNKNTGSKDTTGPKEKDSRGTKENTTSTLESGFTVVKGKGFKKSDKNLQNDQESKQKSKEVVEKDINKKEVSKEKENNNLILNSVETEKKGSLINDSARKQSEASTKPVTKAKSKMNEDDFPPLVSEKPKSPPGFNTQVVTNPNQPPPGFKPTKQNSLSLGKNMAALTLSAVARQFTHPEPMPSALDSNQVNPVPKILRASYIEPSNFEDRNRSLIKKIKDLLDSDDQAFANFKTLSGQYRQNMVQAKEYYENCIAIFGKEKFLNVFPELLVLLPDISKEQELLNVYNQVSKKENQSYGAVPKSSVLNNQNILQVLVCAACQQVLAVKDFQEHMFFHNEDSLFPPLADSNNAIKTLSWVKK